MLPVPIYANSPINAFLAALQQDSKKTEHYNYDNTASPSSVPESAASYHPQPPSGATVAPAASIPQQSAPSLGRGLSQSHYESPVTATNIAVSQPGQPGQPGQPDGSHQVWHNAPTSTNTSLSTYGPTPPPPRKAEPAQTQQQRHQGQYTLSTNSASMTSAANHNRTAVQPHRMAAVPRAQQVAMSYPPPGYVVGPQNQFASQGGGNTANESNYEHPPGYVQNVYAAEMSSAQREATHQQSSEEGVFSALWKSATDE